MKNTYVLILSGLTKIILGLKLKGGYIRVDGDTLPTFVPKFGLTKPGQTHVCPQLWAFCMN